MERKEDSFVKGEIVQCEGDTAVIVAEVLANYCGQGTIDYQLKIIKTIKPDHIFGGFKEGAEFRYTNSPYYYGLFHNIFGLGEIIGNSEEDNSR